MAKINTTELALDVPSDITDLFLDLMDDSLTLRRVSDSYGANGCLDLFWSLYAADEPTIVRPENDPTGNLAKVIASPVFSTIRDAARLDPVEAALGASAIGDEIKILGHFAALKEQVEQALEQALERLGQLDDFAAELVEEGALKDLEAFLDGTGAYTPGDLGVLLDERGTIVSKIKIADLVARDPRLLKIVSLVGRLHALEDSQGTERSTGATERGAVEQGRSVRDMLVREHGRDDDDFAERYRRRTLHQREREDVTEQQKGTVVILTDKSDSMHADCLQTSNSQVADRDQFASAISLASLRMCRREQRDLHVVPFNGCLLASQRVSFPQGQASIDRVTDMLAYRPSGGTSVLQVLEDAIPFTAALNEQNEAQADLLMVTDAEDYPNDERAAKVAALAKQHGVRCFFMFVIDTSKIDARYNSGPMLEKIAKETGGMAITRAASQGDLESGVVSIFREVGGDD